MKNLLLRYYLHFMKKANNNIVDKRRIKMALFNKKSLQDFSLEELEAEIEKRKQAESENVEESESQETSQTEEVADEVTETVAEEIAETPEMEEAVEEEVTEDVEEEKIDANTEIIQSLNAKLEAGLEEIRAYKEKVDALMERVAQVDKPAESVGLEKGKKVEAEKSDDELSAFEIARKYAKY